MGDRAKQVNLKIMSIGAMDKSGELGKKNTSVTELLGHFAIAKKNPTN
jgi:hypothetical protein